MAGYAYYALHKLHILPSTLLAMDARERAFVIASIQTKAKDEEKERKEVERRRRK